MIFLGIIFSTIVVSSFGACPNNGAEWLSVCYYFQGNASAFVNAEETCISLGGHLASIHNGFTNAFIAQQGLLYLHESTVADIWIGATDLMEPGTFTWTDGSDFTFTEWGQNKSTQGQNCGVIRLADGTWAPDDCFKTKAFVCAVNQIPNITSTTTTPRGPTTTGYTFYDCGADWIYFHPTRSCYGALKKMSWNKADNYCEGHGAHLISIHSYLEKNFVITLGDLIDDQLWLGLYSTNNGATWQWTDGTRMDYDYWKDDFPKYDSNLCGYMKSDGQWWNDRWCSNDLPIVCKKKIYN